MACGAPRNEAAGSSQQTSTKGARVLDPTGTSPFTRLRRLQEARHPLSTSLLPREPQLTKALQAARNLYRASTIGYRKISQASDLCTHRRAVVVLTANFGKAHCNELQRWQSHNPATQAPKGSGAEWGVRTLRQACCQENPGSAMCVQNLDDSRGLAIRITYRISLRSSSLQ